MKRIPDWFWFACSVAAIVLSLAAIALSCATTMAAGVP
jgi:hypothetical protein